MLQAVVVIFMLFLCSLCLFAVIVIVRDIIHENAKTRRERIREENAQTTAPQIAPVTAQLTAPAPIQPQEQPAQKVEEKVEKKVEEKVEEVTEEETPFVEEVATLDGNAVVFSKQTLTMAEKYAQLSSQYKKFFEEIARHALSKDGVKELKLNSSYDYKDASYRVVRLSIKRGEIVAEFKFIDIDFMNYANTSDVKIKQAATQIKVIDANSVGVVKDGIDLVVSQIAEYKQYKKKLANEKRREKRKKDNA